MLHCKASKIRGSKLKDILSRPPEHHSNGLRAKFGITLSGTGDLRPPTLKKKSGLKLQQGSRKLSNCIAREDSVAGPDNCGGKGGPKALYTTHTIFWFWHESSSCPT